MIPLEAHKGIALTVMFLITAITSLSPLYVRKIFNKHVDYNKAQVILGGCLCFGAGVLLATVFLHILPSAIAAINSAMQKGFMATTSYPIAQLTMCAGFFLVYLIEEIVHPFLGQKEDESLELVNNHGTYGAIHTEGSEYQPFGKVDSIHEAHDHTRKGPQTHEHQNHVASGHDHSHINLKSTSMVASLIVVTALSFHGVLEGMVVGLETKALQVWIVFGALISHKVFIGFSMAMEILEAGASKMLFIMSMVIFTIASPIGGVIGIVVADDSHPSQIAARTLASAFLQSLSGGTILYVTFCEVLMRERAKPSNGLIKLACVVLGFGAMAGLQAI